MSVNAEVPDSPSAYLDTAKLATALAIVCVALVAFYWYADRSLLLRIVGLLAAGGVAIAIAYRTARGKAIAGFFRDAQMEVRKVVWPTREETMQTTMVVLLVVIVVSIGLWLLDMFLGWGVQSLTAVGG